MSTSAAERRAGVFDALLDAAALVDEHGTITSVNAAWAIFATLNGGSPQGSGVGVNYLDVCRQGEKAGDVDSAVVAGGLAAVLHGRLRSFEHRYPCPSAFEDRWFIVRITPVYNGGGALVCHLDVTAAKLAQERLAHQATHDPLTGLPNREAILDHLRAAMARLDRTGAPVAALFLDLDGFKPINDRYGHESGDRLLVTVASRLQRQLRATDIVGRVGGDEFLAICDAVDAGALVARLREAVTAPVQIGDLVVSVGISIGVAVTTEATGSADAVQELLATADERMYEDKRRRSTAAPQPA